MNFKLDAHLHMLSTRFFFSVFTELKLMFDDIICSESVAKVYTTILITVFAECQQGADQIHDEIEEANELRKKFK